MKHYQEWLIKHRTLTRDTTKQGWFSNFQNNWTGNDKNYKGNGLPWNNYKHKIFIINKATINSRDVLEINLSLKISKVKGPKINQSGNSLFWNLYDVFHLRVCLKYIETIVFIFLIIYAWELFEMDLLIVSFSLEHFFF